MTDDITNKLIAKLRENQCHDEDHYCKICKNYREAADALESQQREIERLNQRALEDHSEKHFAAFAKGVIEGQDMMKQQQPPQPAIFVNIHGEVFEKASGPAREQPPQPEPLTTEDFAEYVRRHHPELAEHEQPAPFDRAAAEEWVAYANAGPVNFYEKKPIACIKSALAEIDRLKERLNTEFMYATTMDQQGKELAALREQLAQITALMNATWELSPELQRQVLAWLAKENQDRWNVQHRVVPQGMIEYLNADLAAARKDAERYEFLRSGAHLIMAVEYRSNESYSQPLTLSGPALDVEIDAAIAAARSN